VFVPGLLIQLGIFGSMFVGFGIIAEIRHGSVDGARAAFRNDLGDGSLLVGLLSAAVLAIIGLAVATRTFQRESA
jgi:ABC-2 type transport system permease protein